MSDTDDELYKANHNRLISEWQFAILWTSDGEWPLGKVTHTTSNKTYLEFVLSKSDQTGVIVTRKIEYPDWNFV